MSNDQRAIAVWAGGACAVIVAGLIIGWAWRGGTASAQAKDRKQLTKDYEKLYAPGKPEQGRVAVELLQGMQNRAENQDAERAQAATTLLAQPPKQYLSLDLVEGQALASADLRHIEMRAQSFRVQVPPLPFATLDANNASVRTRQLMQIYLVRQVVEICIDAGLAKIESVAPGAASADASGTVAMFPCAFAVSGAPEQIQALLVRLRERHGKGLGLRAGTLTAERSAHRLTFEASVLIENREAWQLPREQPGGAR